MRETLWADLLHAKVVTKRHGLLWRHILWGITFRPTFACVFWYRVNRLLYLKGCPHFILLFLSAWRFYRFGNDISYLAEIGDGLSVGHAFGIVIGGNAKLGRHCLVRHNVTIGQGNNQDRSMPVIGDGVEIGAHTLVLGGITIGDRAKLGAMSLINSDVEPDTLVFGIPPNQTRKPLNS